uniref:RHS repeat-associated core domain-containing protein n=1 Tax=Arhodomonas sp. AD133 TaxID=3415009 RepID=UPI003EBB1330
FWLTEETVNGNPVTFDYDDDGLLTQAGALGLTRDTDHGLVTATSLATLTGSRGYNAFGELAERAVTESGTTLYDVAYTRDKLGRIVEKTVTLAGETHTLSYDYDTAGRLTDVYRDGTEVHGYSYDANGNRTAYTGTFGDASGAYDAQDRLTNYAGATYTHNAAGYRTSKTTSAGTTEYDYDAMGNLRGVTLADGTAIEYVIDGQDRRIGKRVDGQLVKGWLYRDQLNPVAELDKSGNVVARFVYADKANVPAYMIKGGTTYRLISNHLGSVRLVVNTDTGDIAQRLDYGPFGQVTEDTNPGFQPFGFAGGLYDPDIGLVRFGARDYDPEVGRWTAKDPILFAGSDANLYGYSLRDPINLLDPNGLQGSGYGDFVQGMTGMPADQLPTTQAGADNMSRSLMPNENIIGHYGDALTTAGLMAMPIPGGRLAGGGRVVGTIGRAAFCKLPFRMQEQFFLKQGKVLDFVDGYMTSGPYPASRHGAAGFLTTVLEETVSD